MANNLSLSNVINVTLVPSIAGLSEFNTANLLLYSTDVPINNFGDDVYRVYYNASSVAEDFGVDSLTYKMALSVFSQTPNILSNSGALIIAPKRGEETLAEGFSRLKKDVLFCGWMTTDMNDAENALSRTIFASIEANVTIDNVETIKSISSPSFSIATNVNDEESSSEIDYTTIDFDFSDLETQEEILSEITNKIREAMNSDQWNAFVLEEKFYIVCYDNNINNFVVSDTDLTAALKIDSSSNPTKYSYEHTTGVASLVNAENNKIQFIVTNDEELMNDNDIFYLVKQFGFKKTRCLFYGGTQEEAKIMMAAYASKAMSTIFEASLTTQTMHLKPLAGVAPDPVMTETLFKKCKDNGVDSYISIEGVACVFSTGANGFFDEVFNELWFVNALQTAGFNYLRQTNTKIPQTENGMTGLKNAYAQVCVRGVNNGFIGAGSWTSSDTFGNPDLFKRNIETSGFYIYSTPVAQQSKADREERKAPLVQIAVKTAGAIHSTNVMIYVNL